MSFFRLFLYLELHTYDKDLYKGVKEITFAVSAPIMCMLMLKNEKKMSYLWYSSHYVQFTIIFFDSQDDVIISMILKD